MTGSPQNGSRLRWAVAGAVSLLLLLALVAGVLRPGNGAVVRPPDAEAARVRVGEIEGTVERQRPGEAWTAVREGEELSSDQVLRTGTNGSAVLDIADRARVQVSGGTRLSVADVQDRVSKVRLEDGRINAVVLGDALLRVETKDSDVVAESGRGEFSAIADGRGRLVVASREGKVKLTAASRTVEISSGEQPGEPRAIPASLFLKLEPPRAVVQRDGETTVEGSTTPGSVVMVNGKRIAVSADGRFVLPVALEEGPNQIVVTVEDALGRVQKEALPTITRDSNVRLKTGVTF